MSDPVIEAKGPTAKTAWRVYSPLLDGDDLAVLEDLCLALDEHLALFVRVQRGDAGAADRANLRVLEQRVTDLRGQVSRAAAWTTFTRENANG